MNIEIESQAYNEEDKDKIWRGKNGGHMIVLQLPCEMAMCVSHNYYINMLEFGAKEFMYIRWQSPIFNFNINLFCIFKK